MSMVSEGKGQGVQGEASAEVEDSSHVVKAP